MAFTFTVASTFTTQIVLETPQGATDRRLAPSTHQTFNTFSQVSGLGRLVPGSSQRIAVTCCAFVSIVNRGSYHG